MISYSLKTCDDLGGYYEDMRKKYDAATTPEQKSAVISNFCQEHPKDMVSAFITKVVE
jgi:hypothetical protein